MAMFRLLSANYRAKEINNAMLQDRRCAVPRRSEKAVVEERFEIVQQPLFLGRQEAAVEKRRNVKISLTLLLSLSR